MWVGDVAGCCMCVNMFLSLPERIKPIMGMAAIRKQMDRNLAFFAKKFRVSTENQEKKDAVLWRRGRPGFVVMV